MKRIMTFLACLFFLLGLTAYSSATLMDMGGGFIYDDDRNITWLSDANYAYTSGWDSDGRMTWDESNSFITAINAGVINNFGYIGWRLPVTIQPDANCSRFDMGSAGINCRLSEMAHLFYYEIGGYADSYIVSDSEREAIAQSIPYLNFFINFQPYEYWSGTEYASATNKSWDFAFNDGSQYPNTKDHHFFALLVHDGKITPVPEPSSLLLLGLGIFGVVVLKRKITV